MTPQRLVQRGVRIRDLVLGNDRPLAVIAGP